MNVGAAALFYLIFYGILPSNLILKFVFTALLAGLVVYISGLTKAKVLLQKTSSKGSGEEKLDIQDEYIP